MNPMTYPLGRLVTTACVVGFLIGICDATFRQVRDRQRYEEEDQSDSGFGASHYQIISFYASIRDIEKALGFVDTIRSSPERAEALMQLINELSERGMHPSSNPSNSSDGDVALEPLDWQHDLATNLQMCQSRVDGLRAEDQLPVLVSIADAYDQSDRDKAYQVMNSALTLFDEQQNAKHGWSATILHYTRTTIQWVLGLGFGTLFSGLLVKVFGYYLVQAIAKKIGDETFAKALGTTIATVKKTALILPDDIHSNSAQQG